MSNPIRILVVDDDPQGAERVSALIRSSHGGHDLQVDCAFSYAAALDALLAVPYDVALVDHELDTSDGLALLREAREHGLQTAVVMLTDHGTEHRAVAAMKAGAADYRHKSSLTRDSIVDAVRHAAALSAKAIDRRRVEDTLRASEARFRTLVEKSSDLLVLVDAAGRITYASPSAERDVGWARGTLVGKRALDLLHPDDLAVLSSRFAQGLSAGESRPMEMRVRRQDGTYRTIEGVVADHLRDPDVAAFVINARDVTVRQALEEQIRQVQKMEAVGRLAGGIAHDFNNLLTAILGYCNLLLEDLPAESGMRSDLEEIHSAGDRAAALTRQLLAFSRRQMLQPQPIELSSLVEGMDGTLRRLLGDGIGLVMALEPDLPVINADPASIEEILINLAVNACDAMLEGGRLTVETTSAELDGAYLRKHPAVIPGRYVMLAVSDTGEGMDALTRARVFEPFFTTKGQGKGTGLGLATVYGLVKQSGGYIWVYSEPGHGTVFKVYLPPLDEAFARDVTPEGRAHAGSETVLVVEDEEGVRRLGTEALRRHGYAVLEARDSLEALRVVEHHQGIIDLVVTDVVMPHMTGRELAERIRQARPSLKVLFMSGFTHHAVMQRELGPGASFLQKPFTSGALARRVRELLDSTTPVP
ncbi:MAG: response regulator [Luteitalea sp.]|nr:response regulator [Luteitalea sp.]